MRMVLGLENGILKEIDSVKICNYFILLVMAVMLLGCAKTKSSSQTQDDSLLFVTETDEVEEDAVTIVSSSDGQICLYSRNNHTRDASWGWSIIYDVKDGNKVYTYEGLPDWEGESASVNAIYCLPHPKRHLYIFDAYTRISGAYGYQSFITYELKEHELKRVPVMVNEQGETTPIDRWNTTHTPRRGRCPHRPLVHGTNSPKFFGNWNIIPRGDVGIAPYGDTIHPTFKQQFVNAPTQSDNRKGIFRVVFGAAVP